METSSEQQNKYIFISTEKARVKKRTKKEKKKNSLLVFGVGIIKVEWSQTCITSAVFL